VLGLAAVAACAGVVALGALETGDWPTGAPGCVFPINVDGVPDTSDFYGVEVSHRGKVEVTSADARAGNVHLSLGL
jgi:hypothetical protein